MSARPGSDTMAENIFESNIEGDLDVWKKRFLTFTLRNHKQNGNFVKGM